MGFNKRHLPEKYILQQMVFDHSPEWVVDHYKNADVLMGEVESMEYFNSLVDLVKLNKKETYFKNNLSK